MNTASLADREWLRSHHGMLSGNAYVPATDSADARMARLLAAGYVHRTPKGRYGLTAQGALEVSR